MHGALSLASRLESVAACATVRCGRDGPLIKGAPVSPIRILFPFAGDTGIGGSHVSALDLVAALDRGRYEPHILLHRQAGKVGDYAHALSLDFEVIADLDLLRSPGNPRAGDVGPWRYASHSLPRMMGLLRQINPDIVHTNEGRIHTSWAFPTRLSGRKHVWHHRQDPRAFGVNKLAPLLSHEIVSVSHFSRPVAPVRSIDRKFSVVRSPFDLPAEVPKKRASRQAILEELSLPGKAVLLGWFGTLTERKKPIRFIEAVAEIQRHLPERPVHGLMFGGTLGPHSTLSRDCASAAAERGMEDVIHMMGFRSPIDRYMAGIDVKLVTALNEPFGRTLVEAMHIGTPVVATRHGGNVEAIKDGVTGFLVEPENPTAFVAPVLKLLQDPACHDAITAAARRNLASEYRRDIHVHRICAIYDRLCPASATP